MTNRLLAPHLQSLRESRESCGAIEMARAPHGIARSGMLI